MSARNSPAGKVFRISTMSLRGLASVCSLLLSGAVLLSGQELPATPQPQPSAGTAAPKTTAPDQTTADKKTSETADQSSSEDKPAPTKTPKPPSRIKRVLKRAAPDCLNLPGNQTCWDKNSRDQQSAGDKREQKDQEAQSRLPGNQSPPRSAAPEGQSSSRDTRIDLSPPPDDMKHEGADLPDVTEFHSYDPHKAAKDVEVGDYYFGRKNYRAAESRYAEALEWKPNDAVATFRLAQSQEKLGKKQDALKNYQGYLKILPQGEFAVEAKASIARLGNQQ